MTCIQKEKGHGKKDGHCTIITIPDKLWGGIKAVLPIEKPPRAVGRPVVPYRKVLDGILFILRTGCQWKMLPKEYGSGSTCHRRFQQWAGLDVFKKAWMRLLKIYDKIVGTNWTWQSLDSTSIKSPLGGAMTGNNPTDRSKLGAKRHILTDKKGIPLSAVISSASTHYIKLVTNVVDSIVIKQRRPSSYEPKSGRGKLQQHLCLDKAYNSEPGEQELLKRGCVLHMPHKRKKGEAVDEQKTKVASHHKKHSPKRWVVERTNPWHNRFRKLFARYEKKVESDLGLVQFSCCIIAYRNTILG